MLISAQVLLRDLEAKRLEIALSTFEAPPEDHAKFMLAVGRYRELKDLSNFVAEMAKENRE